MEAVQKHGVARGVWMGLLRLLRCHPFTEPGFDPVPEPKTPPACSVRGAARRGGLDSSPSHRRGHVKT